MCDIDITITATLRPELNRQTAESLRRYLIDNHADDFRFRVILNIDPAGAEGETQQRVEDAYRSVFDEVIAFKPETASFPMAVKRVWEAVSADIVFHAEDSKLLLRPVPLPRIAQAFQERERLACFALRPLKKTHHAPAPIDYDERHQMDVTSFFHKAVTLQPSFFSRDYVHNMAELLRPGVSPEKVIKGVDEVIGPELSSRIRETAGRYEFGSIPQNEVERTPYYENVGRTWRLQHRLTKPPGSGMGSTWSKQKSIIPSNKKHFRLWKEVRGRQLRQFWERITFRNRS